MDTLTGNDTENKTEQEQCKRERAPYLVVDYGEQLVSDIADVRDELHKEILSVIERVHLLWEILRTFMLFIITVVGGILTAVIFQVVFPKYLAEFCFTSCFGITIVMGFLTLSPLMDAVNSYHKHIYYTPNFIECHCEVCSKREPRTNGADQKRCVEAVGSDDVAPPEDVSSDCSLSDEPGDVDTNNNEGQPIPSAETVMAAN